MNDLIQKHKKLISDLFNKTANLYGTVGPDFFNYFGNRIVEYAEIEINHIVLDAGCGRGASLFPASKKVGNFGKVIGIDLSPEMITKTKHNFETLDIKNVELKKMDVEELTFSSNTFDSALCGFGLFFLPNLELALKEINRVLKQEGKFVTSTFGERDARWKRIRDMIGHSQKKLKPIALAKTKMLDSKEDIKIYFENIGLKIVDIFTEEKEFYYKDEEEWWQTMWSHGYRGFLERLEEKSLNEFKQESFKILSE